MSKVVLTQLISSKQSWAPIWFHLTSRLVLFPFHYTIILCCIQICNILLPGFCWWVTTRLTTFQVLFIGDTDDNLGEHGWDCLWHRLHILICKWVQMWLRMFSLVWTLLLCYCYTLLILQKICQWFPKVIQIWLLKILPLVYTKGVKVKKRRAHGQNFGV